MFTAACRRTGKASVCVCCAVLQPLHSLKVVGETFPQRFQGSIKNWRVFFSLLCLAWIAGAVLNGFKKFALTVNNLKCVFFKQTSVCCNLFVSKHEYLQQNQFCFLIYTDFFLWNGSRFIVWSRSFREILIFHIRVRLSVASSCFESKYCVSNTTLVFAVVDVGDSFYRKISIMSQNSTLVRRNLAVWLKFVVTVDEFQLFNEEKKTFVFASAGTELPHSTLMLSLLFSLLLQTRPPCAAKPVKP